MAHRTKYAAVDLDKPQRSRMYPWFLRAAESIEQSDYRWNERMDDIKKGLELMQGKSSSKADNDTLELALEVVDMAIEKGKTRTAARMLQRMLQKAEAEGVCTETCKGVMHTERIGRLVARLAIKNRDTEEDREDLRYVVGLVTRFNGVADSLRVEQYRISGPVARALIEKAKGVRNSGKTVLQLIKLLYDRYESGDGNGDGDGDSKVFLDLIYRFVQDRLNYNDVVTAYSAWKIAANVQKEVQAAAKEMAEDNEGAHDEFERESDLYFFYDTLSKLISAFSKNKRYRPLVDQLISDLPISAVNTAPGLMTALLEHCKRTKNSKLAGILLQQYDEETLGLPTKYTPAQMSTLFRLALSLGQWDRAKEILANTRENLIKFNASDFNALVAATIGQDVSKAWKLICDASTPEMAKYAYITYLNHMIDSRKVDFGKTEYIFSNAKRIPPTDHSFWDYFCASYFKYTVRKYGPRVGTEVFSSQFTRKGRPFLLIDDIPSGYRTNPFTQRHDKVRIQISKQVQPIVLRDIFQQAYKLYQAGTYSLEEFHEIRDWCSKRFASLDIGSAMKWRDLQRTLRKNPRRSA